MSSLAEKKQILSDQCLNEGIELFWEDEEDTAFSKYSFNFGDFESLKELHAELKKREDLTPAIICSFREDRGTHILYYTPADENYYYG
jgi:hypothetical protein